MRAVRNPPHLHSYMDSCASGFDEATNKFKPAAGGNAAGVDAGLTDVLDLIVVDEDVEKSKDWEWNWSCNECKANPVGNKPNARYDWASKF
ncbi:hypothetical protein ZWY2020_058747 [Hordeum vulgare]|nr:hypothetical protein ZWY2020_058747 [Hordeum vulgare]